MKCLFSLLMVALFVLSSDAQSKPTTSADYTTMFKHAVSETNKAFPFIFTVVVDEYKNGERVYSETMLNDRQAAGVERKTRTFVEDGKRSVSYQVEVGFGKVHCSDDGISWLGPQQYECSGPTRIYGRRDADNAEYSVEEKTVRGERVKVYREYVIYRPTEGRSSKEFKETIATVDSRGFFISIVNNEGTLDPKSITMVRKQSWDFKTKFKRVVAPK